MDNYFIFRLEGTQIEKDIKIIVIHSGQAKNQIGPKFGLLGQVT
jgi:hypothetical protein